MSEIQKPVSSNFTAEQEELGFIALALNNGNGRKASEELAAHPEHGFKIAWRTLYQWKERHPDRYAEAQRRIMPQIRTNAADRWAQISALQAEAAAKATERTLKEIDNIPPERLSSATKDLVYAGAISLDKARDLRGEATTVVEHRSGAELLRELEAEGVRLESIEAEVVGEETVAVPEIASAVPANDSPLRT